MTNENIDTNKNEPDFLFNQFLDLVENEKERIFVRNDETQKGIAIVSKKDLEILELLEQIIDFDVFLVQVANENNVPTWTSLLNSCF